MRAPCITLLLLASATASAQQIDAYRYWYNDNAASATTITVAATDVLVLNTNLPTGPLGAGYHLISLQVRDTNGNWSVPRTGHFVRASGQVNGYEWWTDDAIEDRTPGTIGPGGLVTLVADLPVPALPDEHLFTIRFSSANGTWSVPISTTYSYHVGVAELPGISGLLLFPNPATDQLGLRLNSDAGRTLQLEVVDLAGQHVLDLGSWAVAGSTWRNWDISGLANGAYLLRVTGEKSTWNTRFMKQ
ncbi:MAG: T9SS type A sorting domain-containing protein [Flavobacteriales bacterium]|nr:T9SS type A sorting domain-containing protein [Flavobacteriales bacterium]